MTDPTERNRLDEEESPYLRQHAGNPVHWQPWDEQALAAAKERNVPIFLSIGYSACHWCHVMEEESFEDEKIANLLNDHFVPIKVDREERPDLDSIYMSVCQLVRGGGGWPLSVFLTPEGKPFYVGTYFPKEAKRGQPGFRQLLLDVIENWEEGREDIEERAEQWTQAVRGELEEVPSRPAAGSPETESPGSDVLTEAADGAVRQADETHGGFGNSPKFPQTARVLALFRAYDRTYEDAYRDVATDALDAMAAGGLYDHVGGGFHRYCTDQDWTVPHFEKMLYDQAELVRSFLAGYQVAGDERYAEVVRETLDFVDRELGHEDGGFFSTLDARSEGEEGKFYVWTPEQVREAVADETDTEVFCERFGVTVAGNFEGDTVLTRSATVDDLAAEFDLAVEEVEERLERAREQVFEAREERVRPDRDEKVLAGWNGLMISAFAEAGFVLDEEYADRAVDALDFVRDRLWDGDQLSRRWKDGDVKGEGYLEDYAFLARGALDCYQVTGDVDHLAFAVDLARVLTDEFWDEKQGTLYFTPESGEQLVARPQELGDSSTPSSLGVAVQALLALDPFVPHEGFANVAERTLETHAGTLDQGPAQHATLAIAADALANGHLELTVAADALPDEWRDRLAERYIPDRLLSVRPPTEEGLGEWVEALDLDDAPPIWAGREARDGPTIYVCRRACSPPVEEIEEAIEWVEDYAA